jgi:hypothetical protein
LLVSFLNPSHKARLNVLLRNGCVSVYVCVSVCVYLCMCKCECVWVCFAYWLEILFTWCFASLEGRFATEKFTGRKTITASWEGGTKQRHFSGWGEYFSQTNGLCTFAGEYLSLSTKKKKVKMFQKHNLLDVCGESNNLWKSI